MIYWKGTTFLKSRFKFDPCEVAYTVPMYKDCILNTIIVDCITQSLWSSHVQPIKAFQKGAEIITQKQQK